MKIFDSGSGWKKKVNFVDENNVFVGYDMSAHCCEDAGWFISEKEENTVYDKHCDEIERPVPDVEEFVFDKKYFVNVDCNQLDSGGMVRFRLVSGNKELFLHIYNAHNGYYSHGFEFKNADELIQEGDL